MLTAPALASALHGDTLCLGLESRRRVPEHVTCHPPKGKAFRGTSSAGVRGLENRPQACGAIHMSLGHQKGCGASEFLLTDSVAMNWCRGDKFLVLFVPPSYHRYGSGSVRG